MLVQLLSNWNVTDCNTHSNLFQLGFILLMICRLVIQELAFNQIITKQLYTILSFITSAVLLLPLAIYQSYTVANNSDAFYYDPATKEGN